MTVNIVNKFKEPCDIYIGRGSPWGNPFPINDAIGDTREVVIEKYRHHLFEQVKSGDVTIQQLLALERRLAASASRKLVMVM